MSAWVVALLVLVAFLAGDLNAVRRHNRKLRTSLRAMRLDRESGGE